MTSIRTAMTILASAALIGVANPAARAQEAKPSGDAPKKEETTREIRVYTVKTAEATGSTGAPNPAQKPTEGPARSTFYQRRITLPASGDPKEATRTYELRTPVGQEKAGADQAQAEVEVLSRLVKLQATPGQDPHRDVLARLKEVANASCAQCHAGGVSVRKDEWLGLTVVAADETLRAQLKLDGKGLVVTAVAPGSSGASGGVKEKDIVVAVAGKPVASVEEFQSALTSAGAGPKPDVAAAPAKPRSSRPIPIRLIRAGEAKDVNVPPPFPPTLLVGRSARPEGEAAKPSRYWIGVALGEVDDTLREHLKLAQGTGLVITDVVPDSPASKVEIAKNDVLLDVDGKPVAKPDQLVTIVQASRGEAPLRLRLRHAGTVKEVAVRPEPRKETEVPQPTTAPAPGEQKVGAGQVPWINQVVPLLDARGGPTSWATPGQVFAFHGAQPMNGTVFLTPDVKYTTAPVIGASSPPDQAELKKVTEDLAMLISRLREGEAERKAVADWVKKAAPPAESMAKIDAQLKALESQVAEIQKSMDELKASLKKAK